MARELSNTAYYDAGHRRLVVAHDIVERIVTELTTMLPIAVTKEMKARFVSEVIGAFLLHGIEAP